METEIIPETNNQLERYVVKYSWLFSVEQFKAR